MPWIHFYSGNNGETKACCVANIKYGNINSQSLETIWKGDEITSLREKFRANKSDKRCSVCVNNEIANNTSIRLETLEKYGSSFVDEISNPFYFDIRFSNVCNYRCRTCWHGASSKWYNDAVQLKRTAGKQAIIQNISDLKDFIEKLGPSLLNAKEIYFAGGEPLVTEEHYLLLEFLVQNNATDVLLRYNTNLSHLSFKRWDCVELWSKFKRVEIAASIDGIMSVGEYIRKDMNWDVVRKNRNLLRNNYSISFKIAPTISTLNITHFPDLFSWATENSFIDSKDLYLNYVDRPTHYNIQCLPTDLKREISLKYHFIINQSNCVKTKEVFQNILDYMNAKDHSDKWPLFISETTTLDQLRKESISNYSCYGLYQKYF